VAVPSGASHTMTRAVLGKGNDESTTEDTTDPPFDDLEQPAQPRILIEFPSTYGRVGAPRPASTSPCISRVRTAHCAHAHLERKLAGMGIRLLPCRHDGGVHPGSRLDASTQRSAHAATPIQMVLGRAHFRRAHRSVHRFRNAPGDSMEPELAASGADGDGAPA